MAVWPAHEETELPIGTNFAGYRIEGVAGEGRMGVVYRATHPGLGRVVALKLIARELSDDYGFRRRFQSDAQRAAAIGLVAQHGAPLIYERGESAGRLFLVMRHVPGIDLGALIAREGGLEPARAVAIVDDVAAVLDVAHRRGIVHGDLKPTHVLLCDEPGARAGLIDFGLTPPGAASPDHVAPEVVRGEPTNARSDVYALGAVLFHMLAGQAPSAPSAMPSDVPPALHAVMVRALSISPADRQASAGELARAARAALRDRASIGRPAPVGGAERPARARRGLRAIRIALAAAVLAALLAAVVAVTGGGEGSERAPRAAGSGERPAAGERAVAPAVRAPSVVATIAVAKGADGIAFADGAVWVAAPRDGDLVRIDARTNRVTARVRAGRDPDSVAAGGGMAWITSRADGHLRRFEARAEPSSAGARRVGAKPEGIALTPRLAWVVSAVDDSVTRVDRATGAVVGRPIAVGEQPIDVVAGTSGVWTANSADGTVTHLDAATGRVVGRAIRVGRQPKGVTEGLGSVWVANNGDDTVTQIDPRNGRVLGTIRVGDQPSKLAVAAGLVWVTNFGDGTVSRIDPRSGRVVGRAVRVGRRPVGIAFGAGHLWVASLADGTVSKIRP
jgi:YVTN family beta-propeller protein